jgi:hypothetical protein
MPSLKITNPKISTEFVEELQDEPVYQNIKAFSATHAFLRNLLHLCQDQEYASISASKIKEWFASYNINYKKCLEVLARHEIIKIDRHFIVGVKTRRYRLTDKGARLMCEGQMQYLKKLFTDKALKRKLQKQQSYHRTKPKKYKQPFLKYIHRGLMGYSYSQDAVERIEKSNWGNHTKLKALMDLTKFAERDFAELKYNDADSRCWNEFVGMKSELRRYFSLGDLKYRYVIDIRSCHPLFLAHYLVNRAVDRSISLATPVNPVPIWGGALLKSIAIKKRERSERLSITNPTTINHPSASSSFPNNSTLPLSTINTNLHYDGGNSDIQDELNRWNALFSDPDTDPKAVLNHDLGYTRDQAKAALNQTINGSKQYRRFIKWFKANFPLLFAIWDRTDKARVGVEISRFYETELMQDFALYELATKLGLHLTYEFDGCGVMCRDDDAEILAKIQQLIAHVQARSERLWGIRPVIVVKTAAGEPVNMTTEATGKTEMRNITQRQPASTPATHTAASESRRSSSRSAHPGRKHRG